MTFLAKEVWPWIGRNMFGFRASSTVGSNNRRLFSRATAMFCLYLVGFLIYRDLTVDPLPRQHFLPVLRENTAAQFGPSLLACCAAILWSVTYFSMVVLAIPFLTSQRFRPQPLRLLADTALSILVNILSFALLYARFPMTAGPSTAFLDEVYFSAVTFSTLGYGDFAPATDVRLIAALQAILGNLHLGIIVGAAFFATQPSHDQEKRSWKRLIDRTFIRKWSRPRRQGDKRRR